MSGNRGAGNSYCQCCAAGHQSPDYRCIRWRQVCDRWEKSSKNFCSGGQYRVRSSPILVRTLCWTGVAGDSPMDRAPGPRLTIKQVNTDQQGEHFDSCRYRPLSPSKQLLCATFLDNPFDRPTANPLAFLPRVAARYFSTFEREVWLQAHANRQRG